MTKLKNNRKVLTFINDLKILLQIHPRYFTYQLDSLPHGLIVVWGIMDLPPRTGPLTNCVRKVCPKNKINKTYTQSTPLHNKTKRLWIFSELSIWIFFEDIWINKMNLDRPHHLPSINALQVNALSEL